MKHMILVAAISLAIAAAAESAMQAQTAPADPLSVEEAVRLALHLQPATAAARSARDAAAARTDAARAGLLPTVAITASYGQTQTITSASSAGAAPAIGGVSTGYQSGATVRQLVFDFDRTRTQARQAAQLERAAGANVDRVAADTVFLVKQAFYNAVAARRLAGVSEAALASQQQHLDVAEARLKAGLGLPLDVARARTAVASATLALSIARNTATIAVIGLAGAIGVDPRTPISPADSSEPTLPASDLSGLVTTALARRPEARAARAALDAARSGVGAAAASGLPSLSATAGLLSRDTSFPMRNDYWGFGVALQWNPFDSGLTRARIREADANTRVAAEQLRAAEQSIVADVSQACLTLQTSEQRISAADAEAAAATEALRLAEGRYRAGVGVFLDVIDAQTALTTARTNRVNVDAGVNVARAALARAIGSAR